MKRMRRRKLASYHKLFVLVVQPGHGQIGLKVKYSNRDFQKGFKSVWKMDISLRQITNLLTKLEKDQVIIRHIAPNEFGRWGPGAQLNTYEIIDPEKAFSDLFTPKSG